MYFLRFFFIFSLIIGFCRAPDLDFDKASRKINEIIEGHVSQGKLDYHLFKKVVKNYFEVLDPYKTYFIDHEVFKTVSSVSESDFDQFKNGSTKLFEEIIGTFSEAVKRRGRLEEKLISADLTSINVDSDDLEDLDWAKTEDELYNRILAIRSIQLKTAESIGPEAKEKLLQRISKRRNSSEEELLGKSSEEREKCMLGSLIKSVCSSLDSHTTYFTPKEASQFVIQVQQRLFGIGALLQDDFEGLKITQLIDGGAAKQSGKIKEGDRIIAVNNEPIIGWDIIDSVDLIRGPKGSTVQLTLLREGKNKKNETIEVELKRDEVVLSESRYSTSLEPFGDGVILTFHLHSFYQDPNSSSMKDIKKEIESIQKDQNLKGLILDLRNNGGGLLPQAVSVTGLFIKNGIVSSIQDDQGNLHHLRNMGNEPFYNGPLVVLVNRTSASASEIVAQCLQDYGRAVIVGDKHTFGKGSYQIFSVENHQSQQVNDEGEYKVTKGIYYTVSGKSPQLIGTLSDIEIPGIFSSSRIGEKYEKNALSNRSIAANYKDDLSDIHPLHRLKLRRSYCKHMQEKLDNLTSFIPRLKENSALRIKENKNYQQFLKDIKDKNFTDVEWGQNDLQHEEAVNVMKDLILLLDHSKIEN